MTHALAGAERTGTAVAVLYVDLDGFKSVNDTHGHDTGDQLLIETADRFRACLRPGDTLARLGGDEFVVLLEDAVDTTDPTRTARRLGRALEAPFVLGDVTVRISASIGVALSVCGTERTLLHAADHAMYQAKAEGRGRIVASTWHTTTETSAATTSTA